MSGGIKVADFEVNVNGVMNCASSFEAYSKILRSVAEESGSLLSQLRGSLSTRVGGVAARVSICTNAKLCQADMTNLSKAARQAVQVYVRHENNVKNKSFTKTAGAKKASFAIGGDTTSRVKTKIGNTLLENAGSIGGFISSISQIHSYTHSGEINYGGIAKAGRTLAKTIHGFGRNIQKLEKLSRMNPGQAMVTGAKRFFGLDKAFIGNLRPSTFSSFKGRFYNNFSKQFSDRSGSYTAGGAKSFFAWAGVAVNGVARGISNFKKADAGEISWGRAAAKTVVETAVDTGLNIVVGAAVSAGIAALGFTSAPVIAVGAATALVMAGANEICKFFTKKVTGESKGLTETISDFILDVGSARIKGKAKAVSNAVKAASTAGKAVASFFKRIFW